MSRIEGLGPVRFLIVPNQGHRLDLAAWKDRYPGALVIAPPSAAQAVGEAAPVDASNDIICDGRLFKRHPPSSVCYRRYSRRGFACKPT